MDALQDAWERETRMSEHVKVPHPQTQIVLPEDMKLSAYLAAIRPMFEGRNGVVDAAKILSGFQVGMVVQLAGQSYRLVEG